eukprot:evm.model.scf_3018.1 EVM.evm.TU.scf_3018.1   scf_3018:3596-7346(+)
MQAEALGRRAPAAAPLGLCLATRGPRNRKGPESAGGRPGRAARYRCEARRSATEAEGPAKAEGGGFWERFYINLTGFPFPLGPFLQRKTIRTEVVKGKIWTFEQPQALGFSYVAINVRMTVIKLKSGGLWVHAPIAPTGECIRLLKELGAPVEYIILPTFAYEHKIFVGPFARKFPKAKVYTAPNQWSWPINLPAPLFGIFARGTIENDDSTTPWADEIEQKLFRPPDVGIGPFLECAFLHKETRTLLVTDAVIFIPPKPLDVIPVSYLLENARDDGLNTIMAGDKDTDDIKKFKKGPVEDTPAARLKGWMRIVLLVLYFGPFDLLEPEPSYRAVAGKLIVSPVLRVLVYSRIPQAVTRWIDEICRDWKFTQIISCHLAAPVAAGPKDLKRAFRFSYLQVEEAKRAKAAKSGNPLAGLLPKSAENPVAADLPPKDFGSLNELDDFLKSQNLVYSDLE